MRKMRKAEREVRDPELIKGILEMCDVINVAFFDEEYPYNLPVNFGYEYEDDLIFYCHHGPEGHKNDLIEKNNKVCVVTSVFLDHIYNAYDKSGHDYRSVMAFGEIFFIDPDSDEYQKAWDVLTACNGRTTPEAVFDDWYRHNRVKMSKIVCKAENVYGKAQRIITSLDQLPLKSDERPEE
ncbi:MAG: pyridoxamine 5'-phosphate oxidase family protein [Oscillospiraceae bacterium]|nr:pyridoxamine 5'-phosphate oxidase family protein [Oscillospiraceae bacterium]